MNTTRLTILAVILSAFLVERTFAGELDGSQALVPASSVELGAGSAVAVGGR
jgi:hypothetical protein